MKKIKEDTRSGYIQELNELKKEFSAEVELRRKEIELVITYTSLAENIVCYSEESPRFQVKTYTRR